jgi:FKBP-type peptidyl-prolyl cis-trans isomerase
MIYVMAFMCFFISCKNEKQQPVTDPIQKNIQEIEAYLKENNISASKTASNLYYIIDREGDGTHPTINDNVTVHYKGYFPDGGVFDSSYDRGTPASFPLNRVVSGWQEGIPLIQRGGAGRLFIPSNLGYGSMPPPGIPANAVLIFDVEILKINNI